MEGFDHQDHAPTSHAADKRDTANTRKNGPKTPMKRQRPVLESDLAELGKLSSYNPPDQHTIQAIQPSLNKKTTENTPISLVFTSTKLLNSLQTATPLSPAPNADRVDRRRIMKSSAAYPPASSEGFYIAQAGYAMSSNEFYETRELIQTCLRNQTDHTPTHVIIRAGYHTHKGDRRHRITIETLDAAGRYRNCHMYLKNFNSPASHEDVWYVDKYLSDLPQHKEIKTLHKQTKSEWQIVLDNAPVGKFNRKQASDLQRKIAEAYPEPKPRKRMHTARRAGYDSYQPSR